MAAATGKKGILRHGRRSRKLVLLLLWLLVGCAAPPSGTKRLKTKYVVIVVIDGVRNSETWGNVPGIIPNMATALKPQSAFLPNFYNDAYTYTNSGHTAIITGVNQPIDNYGDELPANPSIFQYFLKQSGKPATAAWIVSSKDKLHILANTWRPDWKGTYQPSLNAGVNGPGTGYRMDSLTLVVAKNVLQTYHPNLMLINFMEPDGYAHAGNWPYYLRGIARDDRYVKELWDFLNSDKTFKGKTTLLITTDHGRHLDGIDGGWQEHGDHCAGCQQIFLMALGPDFKRGQVETPHTLIDIAPTVAALLRFKMDSLVVVPRIDTVKVTAALDTAAIEGKADSIRLVLVPDTTVLKGRVMQELFK
ncbi:alkaline phosphatase family protein [Pontibacter mangrovi]|uniref:Sulfatase n=1 Tax=Pontibacter mangrovi TaxID=2589816 RepID=A0A501W3L6_9BACT|nr:alkaline phosphatase family protein [Pontibacter mangrovi]TPE44189.1 sulfatase [Pontibacter mangrovi]